MKLNLGTGGRVGSGIVGLLLFFIGVIGIADPAQAATRKWVGADGGAWSNNANWDPAGPLATGDDLLFDAASTNSSVNDIVAAISYASITFEKLHTVTGASNIPLAGGGGIHVIAGDVIIGPDILVTTAQTWTIDTGATLRTNGTINLYGTGDWTLTGGAGAEFMAAGVIVGIGPIIKNGDLKVLFLPANTFTGQVTINAGELWIFGSDGLGVADGTPANGTIVNGGGRLVLAELTTLNEALTLNGTGTATNGALFYTSMFGFAVTITSDVTLATTSSIAAETAVVMKTFTFDGALKGPGALQIVDKTGIVLKSTQNTVGPISFVGAQNGLLRLGAANVLPATATINLPAPATLDLQSFDVTLAALQGAGTITTGGFFVNTLTIANTNTNIFDGTIGAGVLDIVKEGAGQLTFGGANSYSGKTLVKAGTLRVTHADGLGWNVQGVEVTGTGTLSLAVSIGLEAIRLIKAVPADNPQLRVSAAAPITWDGRLDVEGGGTIIGNAGSSLTINGQIYSPGNLTINGVALHLNTALVTVLGTLTITMDGRWDVLVDAASLDGVIVAVSNGAALALNGTSLRVSGLAGINGTVALGTNGTLEIWTSVPHIYQGSITGTGTVNKTGLALQRLAGATSFTGTVNVIGGELVVAHSQAISEPTINVGFGTTLTFAASNTHTGGLTAIGAGSVIGTSAIQVTGGDVIIGGAATLGAVGLQGTTVNVAAGHTLTFGGVVSGDQVYVLGDGTVVFGSSGNALNQLIIGLSSPPLTGGGTVRLAAPNAFPTEPFIVIDTNATFDAGGQTVTLSSVSGNGRIHTGTAQGKVTLQGTGTSFMGTFAGAGEIVVDSGVLAYTLNGTHALTGKLTVKGNMFLHGNLPDAHVHMEGTHLYMGAGRRVGTLTFLNTTYAEFGEYTSTDGVTTGDLTLIPNLVSDFPLTATTARITAHGTVTLTGELSAIPEQNVTPGVFTLIDNDGTDPVVGTFNDLPEGAIYDVLNTRYRISYVGGTGNDVTLTPPLTSYHLAEGATGSFFETELLIANPSHEEVEVEVTFMPEGGSPITDFWFMDPMSRRTIRVSSIEGLEGASFSTIVKSDLEVPLVVERTMRWDTSGYGAHTEKATFGPSATWYFAEGSEGFFRTFLLLANPQTTANVAHVTWMREGLAAVERTYDLAPSSRKTIAAIDDPDLVNTSFGIKVTFDQPGVAERAMYFGDNPIFKGGHESAGATDTSTTWFLAEGATGAGFDTFILVSNPGTEASDVTFTFLPENGAPASITRTVAPTSRITINPEAENLPIPEGPLATHITATKPVIAERAQYWPLGPVEWTEAHNSFGVTAAGTKWGLAEGRAGGELGYQTYILLANAGTEDATVTLTFLMENDNVPEPKTVVVPAQRRVNVLVEPINTDPEEDNLMHFGTLIVSDKPIVVERALYWNVNGVVWAAGTNATATRLP